MLAMLAYFCLCYAVQKWEGVKKMDRKFKPYNRHNHNDAKYLVGGLSSNDLLLSEQREHLASQIAQASSTPSRLNHLK